MKSTYLLESLAGNIESRLDNAGKETQQFELFKCRLIGMHNFLITVEHIGPTTYYVKLAIQTISTGVAQDRIAEDKPTTMEQITLQTQSLNNILNS